ncbi:MAG: pentapeptide repeat-containing protein [Chloroflexota bacterium]
MTEISPQDQRISEAQNQGKELIYGVLIGIGLVLVIIWIGSMLFTDEGYATNVFTEAVSVIATIFIIDRINQWRDERRLRNELFEQLRSPSTSPAVNALERLRREGWLPDKYFIGVNLNNANWQDADINGMNFEDSILKGINLNYVVSYSNNERPVIFRGANLQKATLISSDLRSANLQCVSLRDANIEDAYLLNADLRGADLRRANVKNVKWKSEKGNYPAILPNGKLWTSDVDTECYTNPNHPDYQLTLSEINRIRIQIGYRPLLY